MGSKVPSRIILILVCGNTNHAHVEQYGFLCREEYIQIATAILSSQTMLLIIHVAP